MATRTALVVATFAAPSLRAVLDAAGAVSDLARLLKPSVASVDVGDWELAAFFDPRQFGAGAVVGHHPEQGVADPDQLEVLLYLGPVTLTAVRTRLAEVAPLVGAGARAAA